MRMDSVGCDLESLEGFPVQDISITTLVDEDPGHHEVRYDDGDNHKVVLVDRINPLEVPICKGDRGDFAIRVHR